MIKKIMSIVLVFGLLFSLTCCGENESEKTSAPTKGKNEAKVNTTLQKGEPKSVGDVFKLPDIPSSESLVISEITRQANPDDSVTVAGMGFSSGNLKAYIFSQTTADNAKTTEAKITVIDDSTANIVIDKSLSYGMYGVYVENAGGKSNIALVNKPAIWSVGLTCLTAGETLDIFGENLTTDNKDKTNVFLVGEGEYCGAEVVYANQNLVTIKIPEGLTDQKQYEIRLHNGHGGDLGFAVAKEKLTYVKETAVQFNGKVHDVVEYGADPKDVQNDDTKAIKDAIKAAKDGDVIKFPAGVYFCTENIIVDKALKFEGAGKTNSILLTANAIEGFFLEFNKAPSEVTKLGFQHRRKTGMIQSGFIRAKMGWNGRMSTATRDTYSFYVHDCDFLQETNERYKKRVYVMDLVNGVGIRVEDNTFDCTGFASVYFTRNYSFKNNSIKARLYTGTYYGQNTHFCHDVSNAVFYNNQLQGGDDQDDNVLDTNDFLCGRTFVFQGYGQNIFLGENTVKRGGIPSANAGELVLLERTGCLYDGTISSATADTVTLSNNNSNKSIASRDNCIVSIISGKGKGQYRFITSNSENLLTLDRKWEIIPDSTSRILITDCYHNIAVNNNYFHGHTNYDEKPGGTTMIQVYGSCHNLYFVGNTGEELPLGVCITAFYDASKGNAMKAAINWAVFDNNVFDDNGIGIRFLCNTSASNTPIPGEMCIGVMIRRNTFKNMRDFTHKDWKGSGGVAICMGNPAKTDANNKTSYWHGRWINGTAIENNTFENNASTDITFNGHQENTILRNNKNGDKNASTVHVNGGAPQNI